MIRSISRNTNTFKLCIVFISFLFISGKSFSQTKIGLSTGVNLTSFSGVSEDNASFSSSPGLILGLSGEFNITKDLKIVFQPGFIQRNGNISYSINFKGEIDSFKTKLNYLNFPLFLKVPALNKVAYFNSGISASYLMSSSLEYTQKDTSDTDLDQVLNSFDFSFIFGVGATVHLSKKIDIDFEARYTQSIVSAGNGESLGTRAIPTRLRYAGFQILTNILYCF